MMRVPEHELLKHWVGEVYDPVKAHLYYEKHKKLKGRKKGSAFDPGGNAATRGLGKRSTKAKQRQELQDHIQTLSKKLAKLEDLIRKREHEEASDNRKSKAKKERAAKERDKPKTAAEKAEAARENEKYREKNQQKLKNNAKQDAKSGGGSAKKSSESKSSKPSVSELRSLATKVRGQISVAKQKLAAL